MKKRSTVADVAKAAGVSMMTVSRAMNNKPGVSEELRQRILALANEMDYLPSQIARGLSTRQTCSIGLVVPDITNSFFAYIARGVEDVAYEHGYNVFLINTAEDLEREAAALDSLWQKEIDGAILCSLREPIDTIENNIQRFPAVILINRELHQPFPNVVTINVNDQRGAQMAMQHFLDQKRTKIAFLAGPSTSVSGMRRMEGYRQSLKNANFPFDPQLVEGCDPNIECGRTAALAVLKRRPETDAFLAFNDLVAIGALQACHETNRSVPKDIGVIGADDIPMATTIRPQLSTLRVNQAHIGRLSMRTLIDIFEGEASPASYLIEPELVLRDSG